MPSTPCDQNFSVPFIRRLICLTVDFTYVLVNGSPCFRYAG